MKKIICFLLLFFSVFITLHAQFSTNDISVKATQLGVTLNNIDEIIFFNGINAATSITFSYTTITNFKWSRYLTTPTSNDEIKTESGVQSSTLNIYSTSPSLGYFGNGDGCGYILEYDGQTKYIWVFDLLNVNINLNSLSADNDGFDPCSLTHITTDVNFGNLEYYNKFGALNTIPRKFNLTYYSLDSLNNNTTVVIEKTDIVSGTNSFTVPAPFKTTKFTLEGDQFFKAFNAAKSIQSIDYTPIAVQGYLKAVIAERQNLNERSRSEGNLGGSAPLVIDFTSNPNVPVAQYFEWFIKNRVDSTDVVYYTDKNLRYTFDKAGLYNVKLVVSNSICIFSDSIDATVFESELEVPNVFTPNGDGKNDEFRVAYKSIIKFRGLIYSRWGRKVFEWTDPGKGWNGKIGGKLAQPGAYYYIIEAQGSDIDPVTLKPMIYILKGDINLIRGK